MQFARTLGFLKTSADSLPKETGAGSFSHLLISSSVQNFEMSLNPLGYSILSFGSVSLCVTHLSSILDALSAIPTAPMPQTLALGSEKYDGSSAIRSTSFGTL